VNVGTTRIWHRGAYPETIRQTDPETMSSRGDVEFEPTIAGYVVTCLKAFNILCQILSKPYHEFQDQIQLEDVKDELGRFRIWSGNIGAHRKGCSSLDYRLRDASHISRRVIGLLQDLNQTLQDGELHLSQTCSPT
jgi:hypothetical protein